MAQKVQLPKKSLHSQAHRWVGGVERAGLTRGSMALGHCQLGAVTVVGQRHTLWSITAGFLHDWQEAFISYGKHDGVKRACTLQLARPSV